MEEDKEFGISPLYNVVEVFILQEKLIELLDSYGIPRKLLVFEEGENDEQKKKSLVIPS